MSESLKGKSLFITGASRGIGKAIALRAARDGAKIVIAAKTTVTHPKLPGTIFLTAEEIKEAGGEALPISVDIRDETQIQQAVEQAVEEFGGIDVLVNNASAIFLAGTADTPMKRFDLMFGVNVRGTFAASQACLPYLKKADNPHILNIAPPPSLDPKWFRDHPAYSISKYGMSFCTLGMAEEFKKYGIAVNALWPQTTIATSALVNLVGGDALIERSRKPEIMADAAHYIVTQSSWEFSGQFLTDEAALRKAGVSDFDVYAVKPGSELQMDFFIEPSIEE
ncbi:MAG: NAD(P)-dependent oxidoreductase [Bradymonadales bacterium]|nr:MAG: NAD(P)-dependent oxidoreductase [Bradymonadales bacterium]